MDYTRNGAQLLIGGQKGHVASFNWRTGTLTAEFHVNETVRDVQWLHNETMFAVAQKKYVYIYDRTGMEIHCLRNHIEVNRLEFLPYHFLLASVGNSGHLIYQDTSTGDIVADLRTRLGRCNAMAQNPHNAILHLGHQNGTVTLWSPNVTEPLVRMLCHKSPIKSLAVDPTGHHMVTTGLDGQMKVWDIRAHKPLYTYYTLSPASSLSISQKGLLAVGYGPRVSVWKDYAKSKQTSPYMNHIQEGAVVADVRFCPYDDVLGVGHSQGMTSLIIPGAGEPNYDALEANPFETKKQRQEGEVHALLDKLQPSMISLNPNDVGRLDPHRAQHDAEDAKKEAQSNIKEKSTKGKAARRYLQKQKNVMDQRKADIRERIDQERRERDKERRRKSGQFVEDEKTLPPSLARFKRNEQQE